jgi:hypothetical protein
MDMRLRKVKYDRNKEEKKALEGEKCQCCAAIEKR